MDKQDSGVDNNVGRRLDTVSGGEDQRVHQFPPLVMSRYYVVTDMNSEEAYHITYIPAQCDGEDLTAREAMDLYEGNVITRIKPNDKDASYCIVRGGFDRKQGTKSYNKFGAYEMHVAKIRLVHDGETNGLKGYVCNNLYIPQKINAVSADAESWTVDLSRAAALGCFGEFEDDHGRWVGVKNFSDIKNHPVKNESLVKVDFLDVPRNNWHANHRGHVKWMKNATHRSITEYVKQELAHPLLNRVMQRLLRIDRVIAGGKEYFQMWSESPDTWGYVVNFPVRVGGYLLNKRNALDLYEQRSTVIYHKLGDINNWHYVVPFGVVEELKHTDYEKILAGGHVAKLSAVFPRMDESGKVVVGYKCNNIHIPKEISVRGEVFEINEKQAAQLANFGEMWDWRHSPVVKIANFPSITETAKLSEQPVEVNFIQCSNTKKHKHEGRTFKI